jgi:hypothetical protein
LLHGLLGIEHFVNADVIARGLSAFDPESVAIQAGRIMIERLRGLSGGTATLSRSPPRSCPRVATTPRTDLCSGFGGRWRTSE